MDETGYENHSRGRGLGEPSAIPTGTPLSGELGIIGRFIGLGVRCRNEVRNGKSPMNLFAMHRNSFRAFEAKLDSITADFHDLNGNVVSDHDTFAFFAT